MTTQSESGQVRGPAPTDLDDKGGCVGIVTILAKTTNGFSDTNESFTHQNFLL